MLSRCIRNIALEVLTILMRRMFSGVTLMFRLVRVILRVMSTRCRRSLIRCRVVVGLNDPVP